MKKIILSILIIPLVSMSLMAQNDLDAMRFSQNFYGGTGRSLAMGGAFGALGGDFSSLSINPAGIGVYRGSEFTITPSINFNKATASYLSTDYSDVKYKFGLNNLGFVSTYNTNRNEVWVSASFAIGYNRLNDFNQNISIVGHDAHSSLLDEFAANSNGLTSTPASPYYEDLAYNTYLLNIPDTTIKPYVYTNVLKGIYGQDQEEQITTRGGIGEYTFSFGANYSNKLYLGLTVGIQSLRYDEVKHHTETEVTPIPEFHSFTLDEYFNTTGTGYNLKLGAIYKPVEMVRLGLAFHLPTFYKLESEFHTNMDAYFDPDPNFDDHLNARSDNQINDYNLVTPAHLIGSVALQFGSMGLLSFDYDYVNYPSAKLRSDNDSYTDINDMIQNNYRSASNFRIGGELRFDNLYLRGGYAYYGTPNTEKTGKAKASFSQASAGFGLRTRTFFFDVGVADRFQDEKYYLYHTPPAIADIKTSNITGVATFGFRF